MSYFVRTSLSHVDYLEEIVTKADDCKEVPNQHHPPSLPQHLKAPKVRNVICYYNVAQ